MVMAVAHYRRATSERYKKKVVFGLSRLSSFYRVLIIVKISPPKRGIMETASDVGTDSASDVQQSEKKL
jgi:hypothetical protein